MHGGLKALLPLIFVAAVVASSGCINVDPEAFARTMPMVQEFLEEHPNAELHIVHYTAEEAEGILDRIKEDCGKTTIEAKEYYFVNLTDPDTDLMVRAWIDWDARIVECIYKAGGSRAIRDCESQYQAVCFNEHVYWVDSCGNRQEKKEFCPLGCSEGRCISEPGRLCDPDRLYEEKPDCVCPEGYEMLVIFPRCLQEAVQIEEKPTVADFVTGAMVSYGEASGSGEGGYTTAIEEKCIGGEPFYRCVKRERCRSRAEFRCYNGHVYWFDSCGHRQEKKEYCENGCGLGFCRERNICEQEGGYCVYPVACTEDAKICPDGTVVGRVPPECEFAPCPSEVASASGGGGSVTGMMIEAKSTAVVETITQTEIYPVPAEEVITGYNQCRPGYVPSGFYCPKNGLCCMSVENRERCFDYTVDDKAVSVCASCGNGECERFETCTPTFCNAQGVCTDDCGPLYCPEDCKVQECWDSDGGKNYHKKGVVEAGSSRLEDHCNSDGTLTEKYCRSDGQAGAVTMECPEGTMCDNGACSVRCAEEGEYTSGAVAPEYYYGCCGGLESLDPWPEAWVGGGMLCYDPQKGTPECDAQGTDDEGWYYPAGELLRHEECSEYVSCRDEEYECYVGELSCCEGLEEVPLAHEDETGQCVAANCGSVCRPCGNGVCDENENWCSCPGDCEAPATCYDSDGGLDYYIKGTVSACVSSGCGGTGDQCQEGILTETYCKEDKSIGYETYACPYGCHEGACFSECRDENYQCYMGEMQCCEGLVEVESMSFVNQTCVVDECGTLCLECGNGVCEDIENICMCPEDCV